MPYDRKLVGGAPPNQVPYVSGWAAIPRDALDEGATPTEQCVLLYIYRHRAAPWLSYDDFANGYTKVDGTRSDRGCGAKRTAVKTALKAMEAKLWILAEDTNSKDRARARLKYTVIIGTSEWLGCIDKRHPGGEVARDVRVSFNDTRAVVKRHAGCRETTPGRSFNDTRSGSKRSQKNKESSAKNPADEEVGDSKPDHVDTPAEPEPTADVKAFDLMNAAAQGRLSPELRAAALSQKKRGKKHGPLYDGAVEGTRLRLRAQYIALRAQASGQTKHDAETACKHSEAHLRKAAINVLEIGCTVERYLDVAFDTKYAKLTYATLKYLGGDVLRDTVPGWIPPAERLPRGEAERRAAAAKTAAAELHEALELGRAFFTPERLAAIADDPDPSRDDDADPFDDVYIAKVEAYREGKALDETNDEIRARIAAAAKERKPLIADENASS